MRNPRSADTFATTSNVFQLKAKGMEKPKNLPTKKKHFDAIQNTQWLVKTLHQSRYNKKNEEKLIKLAISFDRFGEKDSSS